MTKLVLALLFFLLPVILNAMEQKRRREAERRKQLGGGNEPADAATSTQPPSRPQAPRPAPRRATTARPTLSEWIEQVRTELGETPAKPEKPARPVIAQQAPLRPAEPPRPAMKTPVTVPSADGGEDDHDHGEELPTGIRARFDTARAARPAQRAQEEAGRRVLQRARRVRSGARLRLDHDELKRAIVLAEVLGPPVSLRSEEKPR